MSALDAVLSARAWLVGEGRARAIEAIERDGGYSRAMAEWGLDQAAESELAWRALAARGAGDPWRGAVALGLARSVAIAPWRTIALHALRGAAPLAVRAPRAQRGFGALVAEALARAGAAVRWCDDEDGERWFAGELNTGVVGAAVFGDDERVERGRRAARGWPGVRFEGYGHGLGAAVCDGAAMSDSDIERAAWDFCAYDGEGCLSPEGLWVTGDGAVAQAVGARMAEAMERWGARVERGALSRERRAMERGWRAGAAAAARWARAGREWSVTVLDEGEAQARVQGIGGRNVLVRAAGPGGERASEWLRARARWITALAVGGRSADGAAGGEGGALRGALGALASWGFAGRVCALGAMQSPPLDGEADPRPPVRE